MNRLWKKLIKSWCVKFNTKGVKGLKQKSLEEPLIVKGLRKVFDRRDDEKCLKSCCAQLNRTATNQYVAVDHLTFGVYSNECFG